MDSVADLHRRYDAERWRHDFDALPRFDGVGLMLGRGTLLVRIGIGSGSLCLDDDRLAALLLVAHGRAAPQSVVKHARRAAAYWRRGDGALAHIELTFARLPRLQAEDDAFRLFLAKTLLDEGMAPQELAQTLGVVLAKYEPEQPRVPAGNGRESGRWARSFLAGASPGVVRALAAFAARFTVPAAVLGALFIPTPNDGGVTEGTLPGAPDISFRLDGPAGLLRLARLLPDGSEAVVVAHSRIGVFFSGDVALGRALGTQLYLDLATAVALLAPDEGEKPKAAIDEPTLCPAPTLDTPHYASDRAKDYEDDVHARVNPIAPIPRGFGVKALDPATGSYVFFDDCFRYAGDLVDGDMKAGDLVEAKGARKEYLYQHPQWSTSLADDVEQAEKELRAARARGVGLKWYYAEKGAADMARREFGRARLYGITVGFMPPRRR